MEVVFGTLGVVGVAFQVVEVTIKAIDLWKRAGEVGADVIMLRARLDIIRARIKSWSINWGMQENKHIQHAKFREYGELAVRYLVIIQHLLLRFDAFEGKYRSLFKHAKSEDGDASAERYLRMASVTALDEETGSGSGSDLVEQLKADVEKINHANMLERWRWARKEGRGEKMVAQIDTLVKDLEDFFQPPQTDRIAAIVFSQFLASANIDSLQALPSLEATVGGNEQVRLASSLAKLKIIAVNLGQRATGARKKPIPWTSVKPGDAGTKELSLEPCKAGREVAELDSTSLGAGSVLIEWKVVPAMLPREQKDVLKKRVYDLGTLLNSTGKPSEMRTLDCLGILQKPVGDATDAQYGMVFRLPRGQSPFSLHSQITEPGATPSLDQKFGLARALANAVLYLHLASWLHKGIRSDNVLFFAANTFAVDITEPYLGGFEYSRLNERNALTENTDDDLEHNLYRHPEHQGWPVSGEGQEQSIVRRKFTYRADLYSLGVVLLEIGLWETATQMYAAGAPKAAQGERQKEAFQTAFLKKLPLLRAQMGGIYAGVTERCLMADFELNYAGEAGTIQEAFYVSAIRPLESCTV
jgi:hypothetical protein